MPCPRFEDSTILELLKMGQGHEQCCFVLEHARELAKKQILRLNFEENLRICGRRPFFLDRLRFAENLRIFFLENTFALSHWFLASNIPVFGLEIGLSNVCLCPWPRIFLCLGFEPFVLDSTFGRK